MAGACAIRNTSPDDEFCQAITVASPAMTQSDAWISGLGSKPTFLIGSPTSRHDPKATVGPGQRMSGAAMEVDIPRVAQDHEQDPKLISQSLLIFSAAA